MDETDADLFLVLVREHRHCAEPPEVVERPLAVCATYEEARRVRQQHHQPDRECVIRYLGATGGGD
jgi:hypothetical protein